MKSQLNSNIKMPEPKYDISSLVVHNRLDGTDKDRLFLIKEREFRKARGDSEPHWYYSGHLLEVRLTSNSNLPAIPYFSTTTSTVSENYMRPLEEIR